MLNLRYDEAENLELLSELPVRSRVAFSLLCASRLVPAYARFHSRTGRGEPRDLEALLNRLWMDVGGDPMPIDEVQAALDRAIELIPSDDDGWDETQPYAEAAAAAATYALMTRLTGSAQEAAWAGGRIYEAADRFVLSTIRSPIVGPTEELQVLLHPIVQSELSRQQRDLKDLAGAATLSVAEHRQWMVALRVRSEQEAARFFQPSASGS